jgi:hypothetical protein
VTKMYQSGVIGPTSQKAFKKTDYFRKIIRVEASTISEKTKEVNSYSWALITVFVQTTPLHLPQAAQEDLCATVCVEFTNLGVTEKNIECYLRLHNNCTTENKNLHG